MTIRTDKEALIALAKRCEAAKAADVNLDGLITLQTGKVGAFTKELDSALSLLPEDWTWALDASFPEGGVEAKCFPPRIGYRDAITTRAATPALALCAAALRAQSTIEGDLHG